MVFSELLQAVRQCPQAVVIPASWGQGRASFGGLMAALVYEAMRARVAPGRPPRSLAITFVGPAEPDVPVSFEVEVVEASSLPPPPHAAKANEPAIAITPVTTAVTIPVTNAPRFTLLAEYLSAPRAGGVYRMLDLATYVSSLRGQVLDRVGTRSTVEPLPCCWCERLILHHEASQERRRDRAGSG